MIVGYAKVGRAIPLTLYGVSGVGGDIEVVRLLHRLVAEGHEVHVFGRTRGDELPPAGVIDHWAPGGAFENRPSLTDMDPVEGDPVFDHWAEFVASGTQRLLERKLDRLVVWIGQHGPLSRPLPAIRAAAGDNAKPYVSLASYAFPAVNVINEHRHLTGIEPILLCPDPRNVLKDRFHAEAYQDHVLAQYGRPGDAWSREQGDKHYSFRTGKLTTGRTRYRYSGIELLAVPRVTGRWQPRPYSGRQRFGILVNDGAPGKLNRADLIKQWLAGVGGSDDYEIVGHWSKTGQAKLGRAVHPVEHADVRDTIGRWRATITFPASNTGWATAKPWECFQAGTLCFKHPAYDDQNHIYGSHMPAELREFLRPIGVNSFRDRIKDLESEDTWTHYQRLQFEYLATSRERLEDGYRAVRLALDGQAW